MSKCFLLLIRQRTWLALANTGISGSEKAPVEGYFQHVSNFPREVTETALAHVIGDKAEQAYRLSDALEKRRKLMEAWAAYCEPKTSGNVVQMHRRDRRVIEIID